jgi:hypothetical protein
VTQRGLEDRLGRGSTGLSDLRQLVQGSSPIQVYVAGGAEGAPPPVAGETESECTPGATVTSRIRLGSWFGAREDGGAHRLLPVLVEGSRKLGGIGIRKTCVVDWRGSRSLRVGGATTLTPAGGSTVLTAGKVWLGSAVFAVEVPEDAEPPLVVITGSCPLSRPEAITRSAGYTLTLPGDAQPYILRVVPDVDDTHKAHLRVELVGTAWARGIPMSVDRQRRVIDDEGTEGISANGVASRTGDHLRLKIDSLAMGGPALPVPAMG